MNKKISDSKAQQVHVLTLSNLNGYNRLFGGQLLCWIDEVAAVVARRHSCCNVTTASIDMLKFKKPAYANETIVIKGELTYVGRTSMEVEVLTYVEKLDGENILINEAYVIMVALGKDEKPVRVPELILETPEEQIKWDMAVKRKEHRNAFHSN